jgi:hypothetical protein
MTPPVDQIDLHRLFMKSSNIGWKKEEKSTILFSMSVTYTTDIFCDMCSQWTHGYTSISAKKAREAAKQKGWKRIHVSHLKKYIDVCPACYHKKPSYLFPESYG